MKMRKVPMRMCVGCREMKPKRELVRVVRSPGGSISVDVTGKASGRGAYLCGGECLKKARKAKALSRALDTPIEEDIWLLLTEALGE